MDNETNIIEFPQPGPAPVLPFDTVEGLQVALSWLELLLADSRAVIAKAPYFGDEASWLETLIEAGQAVIAKAPDDAAALRGVSQVFAAASRLATH